MSSVGRYAHYTWRGYLVLLQVICSVLLVGIIGVTLVNVGMRYVLSQPIVWADEVARLGFVCFSFLGAALAVASRSHLVIDTFIERLGPRWRIASEVLIVLAGLGFFGLLFIGGWQQARVNMGQVSPALRIPLGYVYAFVPLSAVLMTINLISARVWPPEEEEDGGALPPPDEPEIKDPM